MTRPRIRTVKPEMWADERVGDLSRDARLLFVGLITMADDEGRLRALPHAILGHVFPYDDDAPRRLAGWIAELLKAGLAVRYEHEARDYIALPRWSKHQRVNRPQPSLLPPPPASSMPDHGEDTDGSLNDQPQNTDDSHPRAQARVPDPDPDPVVGDTGTTVAHESAKSKAADPDSLPNDFPADLLDVAEHALSRLASLYGERGGHEPTRRGVGLALKRFPDRDHRAVLEELEHWALAGHGARRTVKDWPKTFATFLDRTPPGRATHLRPVPNGGMTQEWKRLGSNGGAA